MLMWLDKYLYCNTILHISYRAIFSLLTSFFINLYLVPLFIYFFKKIKRYQIIRKNGPKTHHFKKNIPTMGGVCIIFSILCSTFLYCDLSNKYIWYVIIVLIGYGVIGFLDDYKKIKDNSSQGLKIIYKYFLLSIFALGIIYIIYNDSEHIISNKVRIPFYNKYIVINDLYIFLSYFIIVGTSNAVNFTDGLDGLAIMPVVFVISGFTLIALLSSNINNTIYYNVSYIRNADELVILCTAIIGSALGFLWFNSYPAKIFMGDVGSLSLGGALGIISMLLHQELLLIIMGGVFVIETISVMIQIISFKLRKKRIFKMAPMHHHYEMKGISEPTIITRFWIVSLILVLISLISLQVH